MPWREVSVMEGRMEFVRLALQEGANRRELCRRFGVSAQTGYKWLRRYLSGEEDLTDRSRRPRSSPRRSAGEVEAAVLRVRDAHPAWGARKIVRCLVREGVAAPAVSTAHAILQRGGRIVAAQGGERAQLRFEKAEPNQLWQMDFKGWVRLADGTRCHTLTVVDDHSRYALCVAACAGETYGLVRARLEQVFTRYGLPEALFVDNGSPWGDPGGGAWTRLQVWLLQLGVRLLHSRPYHPQSRGKIERFHRTLNAEVFALRPLRSLKTAQRAFDAWRDVYNHQRPHEALDLKTPAERYRPSPRSLPRPLPQPHYGPTEIVRRVSATKAYIAFRGRLWKVPKAFLGQRLAIRPLSDNGHYGVFFAAHRVASIHLTQPKSVTHVSEQLSPMSPG